MQSSCPLKFTLHNGTSCQLRLRLGDFRLKRKLCTKHMAHSGGDSFKVLNNACDKLSSLYKLF